MIDQSLLKVANTPDTQFLVQAELLALKNVKGFFSFTKGLEYKEIQYENGVIYKGYVNKDGDREGVGVTITPSGQQDRGEYHQGKLHGTAKVTFASGNTYWGEYKDYMRE